MLYGWKVNSMLTNCLAACAHLSITVSEIQRDICEKNRHFIIPPCIRRPVRGFPSEYWHPLWHGKTRMVSLPDGEKKFRRYLYSFWRNSRTWRTDRRTPARHRVTAYTALMHMHRAVQITVTETIIKTSKQSIRTALCNWSLWRCAPRHRHG